MIVKKLWRRVRCQWWDKKRKVYQLTTIREYVGWFLFGFIPVYLIQLDKYDKVNFEGQDEFTTTYGINEQYGYLMTKDN